MASTPRKRHRRAAPAWEGWTQERILDLRFCDLGLTLDGTALEPLVGRLHEELAERDLTIRPKVWLSDDWFSPDGVAGFAIPFYLAHPRLKRLERRMMLEVEGGTRDSCLKLMRHETGHAVQHGYRLHRRRRWQQLFGRSSQPYPEYYRPRPASRGYVHHLDSWYAQSHPDEDFAETFAVWLKPRSDWRRRYAGWKAMEKLEYVDELMGELAGVRPSPARRGIDDPLHRMRKTLRQHYDEKRERYSPDFPGSYDRDLRRIFEEGSSAGEGAAAFLRRYRRELRQLVAEGTGQPHFTIDQVLNEMIGRCQQLKLRAVGPERRLRTEFAVLLTTHTMHCLYRGQGWQPL